MADIVERSNPNNTSTASGTDVSEVQIATGAANGDVIKISADVVHSKILTSENYECKTFTVQSVDDHVYTIKSYPSIPSGQDAINYTYSNRFYDFPENGTYNLTFKNLKYQKSTTNTLDAYGAFMIFRPCEECIINLDNVTIEEFKTSKDAGVLGVNCDITINAKNNVTFNDNQAQNGGVIYLKITRSLTLNGKTFSFNNNSATSSGGAIYADVITFSGDGSSAIFTDNKATSYGNDLYLNGTSGTVLSFTDNGTYSFDGGIYLNNANAQTVINQAQVTIAGRENDTTNIYQLQTVNISNGGKLTANLDYIDKIENTTITLNGTESQVELYNALLNQVASIKSDTGAGTFDLEYSAANGAVQNESLVISSGRIDVKGYMEGGITVDANGVFSPGNSVGEAKFGGGYELYDGAKLLIEMDETGVDSLIASSFNETNGIIELAIDGIPFGSQYDVITATDGFSDSQDEAYWLGKFGTLPDYMTLSVVDGVYGANSQTVRLSIDRNAVPEPSTWALLLLGAAGLMYVRKRK